MSSPAPQPRKRARFHRRLDERRRGTREPNDDLSFLIAENDKKPVDPPPPLIGGSSFGGMNDGVPKPFRRRGQLQPLITLLTSGSPTEEGHPFPDDWRSLKMNIHLTM